MALWLIEFTVFGGFASLNPPKQLSRLTLVALEFDSEDLWCPDCRASVDPGSVLGDICGSSHVRGFTANFINKVEELTDEKFTDSIKEYKDIKVLHDCIVLLKKNIDLLTD